MGKSSGIWLIVIVVLLGGLAAGWILLRGRRDSATPASGTTSGPTNGATSSPTNGATTGVDDVDAAQPTTEPVAVSADSVGQPASALDEPAEETIVPAQPAVDTPPVRSTASPESAPPAPAEPLAPDATADPVTAAPAAPAATAAPAAPAATAAPAAPAAPAATAAAQEAADDFRRIQGVGPKMAAALQGAGIRTYRQLAELDEAALRATIRAAGLRATATLPTWPQQAKALADEAGGNA